MRFFGRGSPIDLLNLSSQWVELSLVARSGMFGLTPCPGRCKGFWRPGEFRKRSKNLRIRRRIGGDPVPFGIFEMNSGQVVAVVAVMAFVLDVMRHHPSPTSLRFAHGAKRFILGRSAPKRADRKSSVCAVNCGRCFNLVSQVCGSVRATKQLTG